MNITEHINVHYVWIGLAAWSVLAIGAMLLVRGADDRRDDSGEFLEMETQR